MNLMHGLGLEMPDDKADGRMADFRLLAETSKQMAGKAKTETAREDYLRIALEWLQLADEAEARARLWEVHPELGPKYELQTFACSCGQILERKAASSWHEGDSG